MYRDTENHWQGGNPVPANRASADMPAKAPLAMPVQDLRHAPRCAALRQPDRFFYRRAVLIIGSLVIALLSAREMLRPMGADGLDLWDMALGLLFFGLFGWIAFGFLGAVAGFGSLVGAGPGLPKALVRPPMPTRRTAILMPIHNEEVEPLFARLADMTRSIDEHGANHLFDLFVLSDSAEAAESEERRHYRALRATSGIAIYYRRRVMNIQRKPGNIAEWVRQYGAAYDHMIVLDADSLMSAAAFLRMAAAMEANPRLGLLQTVPALHRAQTLFARWQQFSATVYGPVASAGLQWWSGSEATFWGHNAIIRVRAFAESCGLPELTGPAPFGGAIMSHDMVEAALLRRRGWEVQMLALPNGSYEECPPSLPDHAVRDRRWCQGNLQHLRLLGSAGFHWVNRLQLLIGASAYVTSPLWLVLIVASLVQPFRSGLTSWSLLPSGWLLMLTLVMLFGSKLLALGWLAIDHDLRAGLGGTRRVIAGVLVEIPLSIISAPLTMLTQTLAIVDILRGRPSGWSAQRRSVDGIAFSEAWPRHRWHVLLGAVIWIAILAGVQGAIWSLPIAISLTASPWIVMLTARVDLGNRLAQKGIFLARGDTGIDRSDMADRQQPAFFAKLGQDRTYHRLLNP